MAKSRYFYCLFLMNSLINIINFVPRELIDRRFDGALFSILIATVLGTLFVYIFTVLIAKFPGKGFPEIFTPLLPKLLVKPLLVFLRGYGVWLGGYLAFLCRYYTAICQSEFKPIYCRDRLSDIGLHLLSL